MSILDEPNVVSIMLELLENPRTFQEELAMKVDISRNTLRTLLTKLRYEGLIKEEPGERNKKHYSLTNKGKEVALALKKAREALEKE